VKDLKSPDGLVRGGTLVDGTGAAPVMGDVRIRSGRIVEIGPNLAPAGERVYDASGCFVTPGFIDSHTHYDASLFWDPCCDPITLHGVTTVLIGNCSLGLAPIRKEGIDELSTLFSYIEDLPKRVFETEVPWKWETFPEYTAVMRARKWGVNIASLVSHSLLRLYAVGQEAWTRASTVQERERIAADVDAAMAAGAFGVSTSRFDRNPKGDVVPSAQADDAEFDSIFAALRRRRGIVQMIPDLITSAAAVSDFRRMGAFSKKFKTPVISNAIFQRPDDPSIAPTFLSVARELRAQGAAFYHLASPRSIELQVNFHQCMSFIYMPSWNALVQPTLAKDEKLRRLADPQWRARARDDWDKVKEGFPSGGVERLFRIVKVGKPEYEGHIGRTFDFFLDEHGGHPSDGIADWALQNDLETEFVYPFTNTDFKAVGELLAAPETLISASDAGAHIGMFDGAGDSTLVLTRHVRDRKDLTLEWAVKRMTQDQAEVLGLVDRGVIAQGAVADLAIFNLQELDWRVERKAADIPGGHSRFRRPPGGYRFTIIGGVAVQCDGVSTCALPAKFLGSADRVAL
jgi:N-acyl-D-amino-acid deacylase